MERGLGKVEKVSTLDNTQEIGYTMAMSSTFDRVKEFHKAMGIHMSESYIQDAVEFRLRLIWEEYQEVLAAAGYVPDLEVGFRRNGKDMVPAEFLKELADLDYVTAGAAVTFGWDFNEAGQRVHLSNMSKLGDDGKPVRRSDGKVLKGPNYVEPNLGDLVYEGIDSKDERKGTGGVPARASKEVLPGGGAYGQCGCRPCGCGRAA